MAHATRVLLIDDHAVVREGYRRLLERTPGLAVVGDAATGAEGYRRFVELAPDVVVMDISLPDVSGIETLRRMRMREPQARVLVFSIHDEPIFARRALDAGGRGYLSKSSAPDLLVEAVRAVARGELFVGPDVASALVPGQGSAAQEPLDALSVREFEILRLLAGGESVEEIAHRLSLSVKTVANYQTAIRHKLGARTPSQLVHLALRSGLVS
jgi:DNA-binding NarL/FixJ family response regulator